MHDFNEPKKKNESKETLLLNENVQIDLKGHTPTRFRSFRKSIFQSNYSVRFKLSENCLLIGECLRTTIQVRTEPNLFPEALMLPHTAPKNNNNKRIAEIVFARKSTAGYLNWAVSNDGLPHSTSPKHTFRMCFYFN